MSERTDSSPRGPHARIDLRDVYDAAVRAEAVSATADRKLDKLSAAVGELRESRASDRAGAVQRHEIVEDHETRLRSVEKWANALPLATVSSGLSAIAAVVAALVAAGVIG